MKFKTSFCDPFKAEIVEIGDVEEDKIMDLFEKITWSKYLGKMKTAKKSKIYYSLSLEIEDKDNRKALSISAIDGAEWYIFYKRPKTVIKFFGLKKILDNSYLTDMQGQTEADVKECLIALIKNDSQFLENKIK